MNKYYYIFIGVLLLLFAACSDENKYEKPDLEKEEVMIQAGVQTSVVPQSRADDEPEKKDFDKEFYLYLTQKKPVTVSTVRNTAVPVSGTNKFTIKKTDDKTLYWDDIGGKAAVLDIIGLYPKTNAPAENTLGDFTWTIADKQNENGAFENSDLLITNRLNSFTYETREDGKLDFKHVLSKLTINLKGLKGFTENDFNPTGVTVKGINTSAKVTISDVGVVATSGLTSPKDITPLQMPVGDNKTLLTYEAIVMPGQTITKGTELITFDIVLSGQKNTYTAKLPNETTSTDLTFQPGKNHIFTVTVDKVEVDVVSVSLADWEEKVEATAEVKITPVGYTGTPAMLDKNAELYIALDGQEVKYTYTYAESKGTWTAYPTPLFLDNVKTAAGLKADGVLICPASSSYTPEEIYTGQSQEMNQRYNWLEFKTMKHPFSKLKFVIRTKIKENGIALTNKVELSRIQRIDFNTKIKEFDVINLDFTTESKPFQEITYKPAGIVVGEVIAAQEPSDPGESEDVYNVYEVPGYIYISPYNFTNTEKLFSVIVKEKEGLENEYPFKQIVNFEANKIYTLVATLSKTEIAELSIKIEGWEEVKDPIEGGGGIDK